MKKPAQHLIAETPCRQPQVAMTIGIDLGDVWSHYCTLNQDGEVVDRGRFRTTPKAIEKWFTDVPHARVAMEAGVHSIWISEQLQELGHEVIVANVRELRAISHSDRKSDQVDAEKLARYARLDPEILRPIVHRTVEQQQALTLIRARDLLVRLRTAAVNAVRGLTKSCGHRMPASTTSCFAKRSLAVMPPGLAQALGPVLEQIAAMTLKIKHYDQQIQQLGRAEYPETQALLKVHGVGHITALTFVLTLGTKERFGRSRDVGCYLGLRPRRSQSGDRDPQLRITKAGNVYLRSLLIECANHILRPHGRDSALRQWGLHLASRGGKQARNKAVVAVARKLAVLLHRIWVTQEPYMPFHELAA
jgi:transposase